ncbi:MAG: insulinase family protein [Anaerolineales bacterium]|nr:insulinase family protein [Anaerolineales bacterium]
MKKQDFAPLPKDSLPGPHDIIRTELKNGITLLVRPNFNSLSVAIAGYLQAGSLYDPLEKLGLADYTASTLMRGTKKQSFKEIYAVLESMGASLGISSGAHTAGFGGKSLADDLPVLLQILADVLTNPVFPKADIEKIRSQLLTGLDLRAQDTSEMASMGFDEIAYADHPYRHPNDGFIETIQAIKTKDLVNFHQDHYGPKDMVVVIVGPIKPDLAISLVEENLGGWVNEGQGDMIQVPEAAPLEKTIQKHHVIDEKSQSDIVLGVVGPRREWKGFYPALLGNSILGQFGMMGRIGESVRNQAGLAYYAYSSLSSSIGPGPWTVSAGVAPDDLTKALDLIKIELKRFIDQPVSAEELSDVKSNYIGKLPLNLESNGGVASALLTMERHQLGLDYLQQYEDMINEITPQSILEASREYLDPDRLAISTAGPAL